MRRNWINDWSTVVEWIVVGGAVVRRNVRHDSCHGSWGRHSSGSDCPDHGFQLTQTRIGHDRASAKCFNLGKTYFSLFTVRVLDLPFRSNSTIPPHLFNFLIFYSCYNKVSSTIREWRFFNIKFVIYIQNRISSLIVVKFVKLVKLDLYSQLKNIKYYLAITCRQRWVRSERSCVTSSRAIFASRMDLSTFKNNTD